ncbi:GNAT family N-acetyltransferase [Actinoplanes bogorensis]|uniref:GNAT family N-acetyltransferase n=1 Tax=Paractinoplanes bogorensis TaxID=1610840 RepID=A0ABS5Z255_9ACTN|nr:GNAT family N-acetyltransferase [Actinoplanes bogorensis]MBU2669772.1 GNAT family N-acetyltransferase [Actinoplanes bogorensis]
MAYDLSPAEIARRCVVALAAHSTRGRFTALAVGPDDPMADVARTVERQVFEAAFGNDAATMAREYGHHDPHSLHFLVLDRETGRPAGAGRVIEGGGKTLDDAPDHIGRDLSDIVEAHGLHDGGKIWDFATVGVLPEYRRGLVVSSLLYRTFLQAGKRANVKHIVVMLDHRAHRNLMLLGAPLVPMAGSEPFEYLGSASTRALYVPFADLEPAIAEQGRRLRRPVGSFAGEIRGWGLKRLLTRRVAARVSEQVATGEGLNEHIVMPGLERRRFRGRKARR